MPNLPGYNPDVQQHTPTTKKGRKQQSVDLQSFLALAGQRQPLVETAPPSLLNGGLNTGNINLAGADPFNLHAEPSYEYENQSSTPGFFGDPNTFMDVLKTAGKQRTPFDPSAVPDARQTLIDALSAPDPNTSGPHVSGGRAGSDAIYELGRRKAVADQAKDVTTAEQALDDALRAQRARAIGNTVADRGAGNIKKRTDELTDEEYNALPPLQRAAIDYNTLLVDAVRKDRNQADEYNPSPTERNKYNDLVEGMFGEDRGADGVYAPETVALLNKLGIADKAGDLNDFLSLNATIKAKDLDNLRPDQLAPSTTEANAEHQQFEPEHPLLEDRLGLDRVLAHSTRQMEMSLAKSAQLLSSINDTVKFELNNQLAELGGTLNKPEQGMGWNAPQFTTDANGQRMATDANSKFVQGFELLGKKENAGKQSQILDAMQGMLSDSEYSAFLDYLDQRSLNSLRYKQPLFDSPDAMKAARFREMLGLDSGGPAQGKSAPAETPAAGGGY